MEDNSICGEARGIRLRHLDIGYTHRGRTTVVARHLDAEARPGELTCLIGGNGVGKSTLLRTMAAFQPALGGEVWMDGRPLALMSASERARRVSVVTSEAPRLSHTTVEELVAMGRAPYTGFWGRLSGADHAVVREALREVELLGLSHRRADAISDGERQKAMIARALAQRTPLMLLDEPTAFLDYPSKASVLVLLRRLASERRRTVLLSTHDLGLALQLSHRLWLLTPGGLVEGTPHELAASGQLSAFIDSPHLSLDAETLAVRVKA